MYIEREKNSKVNRYNIIFSSYRDMVREIETLGEFIKWHKFTIFIETAEDFECVATNFCDTILVDRTNGNHIAKVLTDNQLHFRFFD